MADFPRDLQPTSWTHPKWTGGPIKSIGYSGKGQIRAGQRAGRVWTETYPGLDVTDDFVRGWLAKLNRLYLQGTTFDIVHPAMKTNKGVGGGGAITINGANQTGESIVVAGTGTINGWLKAGDIVKLPGPMANLVFDMFEDIDLAAGAATLKVSPPIVTTAQSPTNGGVVTISGVKFRAILDEPPNVPDIEDTERSDVAVVIGLKLVFREWF